MEGEGVRYRRGEGEGRAVWKDGIECARKYVLDVTVKCDPEHRLLFSKIRLKRFYSVVKDNVSMPWCEYVFLYYLFTNLYTRSIRFKKKYWEHIKPMKL